MAWQINFTPKAKKELAKLDASEARIILKFLKERVSPNPAALGGHLKGSLREFWRWRVGNYRILAKLENDKLVVLVVQVGHRRKIYGGH
ncbi:MAG: type II toxin-antitoxin system RelE/ParE family toxin [Desulfobulbaceae bacterium]|nr:type II toxin-antitoxin system RelE/ParE family toxin [Desulfobulbaceae bacterium]